MITATIVVFLAIFGGMAVLGLMIWLISRKNRDNSPKNFIQNSSRASYVDSHHQSGFHHDEDDTDFVDNSYYTSETVETTEKTAFDGEAKAELFESTASESSYSPPAESSYSDSSSYDSGGSSDSGSSSSDSGSSSSSD
ncbi:MAG TPA: hypothetical protein PKE69_23580 [Pyrinomonadaceae bacterium]|nr:hypothetical protein [Pyrinomonadaceae bacterium]